MSKMRIYGCGGLGINITSFFNDIQAEPNSAQPLPAYVDASRSNLKAEFSPESTFVLDNVDGSGKVRKENHAEIANVIRQVLLQLEPTDFNVVVFSASGGSGSVIGPLLLSELLSRGLTAVALVVGSDESVITANNTLNTLKSLESIAKRAELPVVMYYEHNDRTRARSEVDAQLHMAIASLAVLSSKCNREMDTKDIANWVQFSKTTSVSPQLSQLEIFTDSAQAEDIRDPISVASIYGSETSKPISLVPEYHAAGYLPEPSSRFEELHYVITIDALPSIVSSVKKTLEQYNTQRDSRVKQESILGNDEQTTDTGLIL